MRLPAKEVLSLSPSLSLSLSLYISFSHVFLTHFLLFPSPVYSLIQFLSLLFMISFPFFPSLAPLDFCLLSSLFFHVCPSLLLIFLVISLGEGVMLREPGCEYKAGRSKTLLKVKYHRE